MTVLEPSTALPNVNVGLRLQFVETILGLDQPHEVAAAFDCGQFDFVEPSPPLSDIAHTNTLIQRVFRRSRDLHHRIVLTHNYEATDAFNARRANAAPCSQRG